MARLATWTAGAPAIARLIAFLLDALGIAERAVADPADAGSGPLLAHGPLEHGAGRVVIPHRLADAETPSPTKSSSTGSRSTAVRTRSCRSTWSASSARCCATRRTARSGATAATSTAGSANDPSTARPHRRGRSAGRPDRRADGLVAPAPTRHPGHRSLARRCALRGRALARRGPSGPLSDRPGAHARAAAAPARPADPRGPRDGRSRASAAPARIRASSASSTGSSRARRAAGSPLIPGSSPRRRSTIAGGTTYDVAYDIADPAVSPGLRAAGRGRPRGRAAHRLRGLRRAGAHRRRTGAPDPRVRGPRRRQPAPLLAPWPGPGRHAARP